jgi:octaprenyl-diphosphate synthase
VKRHTQYQYEMRLPVHSDTSSGLPQAGVPAFKLIDNELGRVKQLVNEQLAGSSETVSRLLGYVSIHGGKMLRPGLVLLAGAGCGNITDKHIRIAAIVEMIHNATLLHDDIIDEGQKRRGAPTVNSLWGNESAVLLGDFLLSEVFKMCADLDPRVTKIIAAAAARTCEGELRQIIQRQNWQLSESEYIDIITEKSAALFSSCCELGALLAEAGEAKVQSLADFGLNVGIAFQITDDLLDIVGDENKTGKTLGGDVDKNKLTLAVIHLLRAVDGSEKSMIKSKLNASVESKEALAEMLSRFGSLEYARSRSQEFVAKAIESLTDLEESDAKDALIETARFVADRAVIS